MSKNKLNRTHKKRSNIFVLFFMFLSFVLLYAHYITIDAESVATEKEAEDLTIYDSSSGFYEVPMSTNVVPKSEKVVESPTMAITDTLILKDDSPESLGLSIYKLSTGGAILHTEVGDGHESSYDVKPFGVGNFTAIKTSRAYACSELNLSQCEASSGYISEKLFSITTDGVSLGTPVSAQTNSTTTVASSTVLDDLKNTLSADGILTIGSTTNPVASKADPVAVILDTINPAESSLVLPETDKTPEVNLDSLLQHSTTIDAPLMIQNDYTNNQEVKNADF